MGTQNNVCLPDDLISELHAKAAAEGLPVEELAAQALRTGLEERAWREMLAYGLRTGLESGHADADVPKIVRRRRKMNAAKRS